MESFLGRSQDVFAMQEHRKKRLKIILIGLAGILAAAGLLVLIFNLWLNRKYNTYEVLQSTESSVGSGVYYAAYEDKVLKCSKNGISALDASGQIAWNGSFDMTSPSLDIAGQYVVVADIGNKKFYVYNGSDSGTEFVTDYPIVQACVSEQGIVAVLMEDVSSNMIHIYNPYDISEQLLVEIPTNVEDGYPVCIDLSPDGINVSAVYVCVSSGKVESRVAFYNFSKVGKNSNCLVGAKNYEDQIISEVRYLDEDHVCVFGDKGFSVWENMKKPVIMYSKEFEEGTINSAFCNEDYIGMITTTEDEKKVYEMQVYSANGKKILDTKVEEEYTNVAIYGKEILFSSLNACMIYRINGVRKFYSEVDGKVNKFFPAEKSNHYYLVTDTEINEVKLQKQKSKK